jgi:5'-nucleotidase (lipoprotein e(P4) family)
MRAILRGTAMRRLAPTLLTLLPLVLVLGCATAPPVAAPAPASPASAVASTAVVDVTQLPDDVRWVLTSAEYRAVLWQAFGLATQRVEALAAGREPGTWAVSVDADETILGNVQYEVESSLQGAAFDPEAWTAWVARQEAVALPGARQFLERVRALGGVVAVVTNRRPHEAADTAANLDALGLPYDLLLPRSEDGEKEARWEAIAAGTAAPGVPPLEIVLWVGDNVGDFPDLDQTLVEAPESALALFGDRYIVLPNPLYGSWKD